MGLNARGTFPGHSREKPRAAPEALIEAESNLTTSPRNSRSLVLEALARGFDNWNKAVGGRRYYRVLERFLHTSTMETRINNGTLNETSTEGL